MTYNEKKKAIEGNLGKIYTRFDVHGMLNYVSGYDKIQDIPETKKEGYHPNHDRALAALSTITKERFKKLIDSDYALLFHKE